MISSAASAEDMNEAGVHSSGDVTGLVTVKLGIWHLKGQYTLLSTGHIRVEI